MITVLILSLPLLVVASGTGFLRQFQAGLGARVILATAVADIAALIALQILSRDDRRPKGLSLVAMAFVIPAVLAGSVVAGVAGAVLAGVLASVVVAAWLIAAIVVTNFVRRLSVIEYRDRVTGEVALFDSLPSGLARFQVLRAIREPSALDADSIGRDLPGRLHAVTGKHYVVRVAGSGYIDEGSRANWFEIEDARQSDGKAEAFDKLVARLGESSVPQPHATVADALLEKAIALVRAGDPSAAVEACDEVVARFGAASEPELRACVARALSLKAHALWSVGDPAARVKIWDEIVTRFGEAREPDLRAIAAQALHSKGINLNAGGDRAAALKTYDEVVARFGHDDEPDVLLEVARAMLSKGDAFRGVAGDMATAVRFYDEVVTRFGAAQEPKLREMASIAMYNKRLALDGQ